MSAEALSYAKMCARILSRDSALLKKIDNYARGKHEDPYMPPAAGAEYRLLAKRCVTNMTGFIVDTPAQSMYVDGFRRVTGDEADSDSVSPEWDHWQRSRLDARQSAVYRAALTYGHSFVVTEKVNGEVISRGLSPLRTAAVYEDAANDEDPIAVFTFVSDPVKGDVTKPGVGTLWDRTNVYTINFDSFFDYDSYRVVDRYKHGLKDRCPVTRFATHVDLDGRTTGLVEPLIPLQDRLNQTIFDLLITQSGSAFKVRTATGMAPPVETTGVKDEVTGEILPVPVIDPETGMPKPKHIEVNAKRMFFAEDPDVEFGTLDETPLNGFIASVEMTLEHISALSNTPPHYMMGKIANLSAEAMTAAETALLRKVAELRAGFGESWERVFRIAGVLSGALDSDKNYHGEVVWRDMEGRSLAQASDGLGKLAESLEIPRRGLWSRVPGVTSQELRYWEQLRQSQDYDLQMAESFDRIATGRPSYRPSTEAAGEAV